MRFLVLLLGLIGAGSSGWFGYELFKVFQERDRDVEAAKKLADEEKQPEAKKALVDISNLAESVLGKVRMANYFTLAGGVLGLLGGVLALARRNFLAALLLLTAPVGACVMSGMVDLEIAKIFALFTAPLALAGLLALFVRRPATA